MHRIKTQEDQTAKKTQETQTTKKTRDSQPREKIKETTIEKFHIPGCLRNILSWGDQLVPQPIDEVVNLDSLAYDRKLKSIIRRMRWKINLIVYSGILCTFEEAILDAKGT
jgi:hypothetical protein